MLGAVGQDCDHEVGRPFCCQADIGVQLVDLDGHTVSLVTVTIGRDPVAAEKGTYRRVMQRDP